MDHLYGGSEWYKQRKVRYIDVGLYIQVLVVLCGLYTQIIKIQATDKIFRIHSDYKELKSRSWKAEKQQLGAVQGKQSEQFGQNTAWSQHGMVQGIGFLLVKGSLFEINDDFPRFPEHDWMELLPRFI